MLKKGRISYWNLYIRKIKDAEEGMKDIRILTYKEAYKDLHFATDRTVMNFKTDKFFGLTTKTNTFMYLPAQTDLENQWLLVT